MNRKISTYTAEPSSRGYCEVWMNFKEERAYIQYFDSTGKLYYTQAFPDHSIHYVHDAAQNWSLGIKQLDFS